MIKERQMIKTSWMNCRITILKTETKVDAIGNRFSGKEKTQFYSCFAYVKTKKDYGEDGKPKFTESEILEFEMRYCKKLNEVNKKDFIVLFNGQEYNIKSIENPFMANKTFRIVGEKSE